MPSKPTKHRPADVGSETGWLKRFETALRKKQEALAKDIDWPLARYYFESARFTPESAADQYIHVQTQKALSHANLSRNTSR